MFNMQSLANFEPLSNPCFILNPLPHPTIAKALNEKATACLDSGIFLIIQEDRSRVKPNRAAQLTTIENNLDLDAQLT
jgi:hypothetical protein